jgi:uncharacterized protein (DUF2384 family)
LATELTSEQRLEKLDHEVEEVKELFMDALEQLRRTPAADRSHEQRWQLVAKRIKGLRSAIQTDDYNREQLAIIANSLLDMRDLLDREGGPADLDICDGLLIALERIRQVVRDALDEHVNGVADDVSLVMADIDRWLPGIADRRIADLIGVDRRTLTRWRKQAGSPRSSLRTFARVVAVLRHSWDAEGVIGWFDRPRHDLSGRRPASLLKDPGAELALVDSARAGRSQYAS